MSEYEYVSKSEYAPVRKELEQIINRVQVYMRKNYGLTFQFRLVGSGRRHLITRIKGGNRGYDSHSSWRWISLYCQGHKR